MLSKIEQWLKDHDYNIRINEKYIKKSDFIPVAWVFNIYTHEFYIEMLENRIYVDDAFTYLNTLYSEARMLGDEIMDFNRMMKES